MRYFSKGAKCCGSRSNQVSFQITRNFRVQLCSEIIRNFFIYIYVWDLKVRQDAAYITTIDSLKMDFKFSVVTIRTEKNHLHSITV